MKKIIILLSSLTITLITTDCIAMLRALTCRSAISNLPVRRSVGMLCNGASYKDESHSEIKEFTDIKTSLGNKVLQLTNEIEQLRSLKAIQDKIDPKSLDWLDRDQQQALYEKKASSSLKLEERMRELSLAKEEWKMIYVEIQRLDIQVMWKFHKKDEQIKIKNKKIQELETHIKMIFNE